MFIQTGKIVFVDTPINVVYSYLYFNKMGQFFSSEINLDWNDF